jgi:CRP/FNR family transcriptional regulator, cyclic AMP receptor protein
MFVLDLGKAAVLKSWHGEDCFLQTLKEGDCFGEMAVSGLLSTQRLYQVYALIQMNMGREVCRRLREANSRLFSAKMGTPEADIGHVSLAH